MLNLTVPADRSYVATVRGVVAALLEKLGVVEDDIRDVELVLGEICTNVVRHAYATTAAIYTVDVELTPRGAALTVTDCGRGFDRSSIRAPQPDRPGGWGIWIVERLSGAVSVTPVTPSGTRVFAELPLRYRTPEAAQAAALAFREPEPAQRLRA